MRASARSTSGFVAASTDSSKGPSVYEVETHHVVRAFAEHAAAAPIDPPVQRLASTCVVFVSISKRRLATTSSPSHGNSIARSPCLLSSLTELDEVIELASRELK